MPTTRAKRQAQEQSGVPPSPQAVLPETSRRRTRAKKTQKNPQAPETKATEHVEDPKSEIQAPSLSPVAHPVPEVVVTSPTIASLLLSPTAHPVPEVVAASPTVTSPILPNCSTSTNAPHAPARVSATTTTFKYALQSCTSNTVAYPKHINSGIPSLQSTSHNVAAPSRIPAVPQTRLHLWLDASAEDLAGMRPTNAPSLALTISSSVIPEILALIAPQQVTTSNKLTQTAVTTSFVPSSSKRKLSDDADMPQPARRLRAEERTDLTSNLSPPRQRKALAESNLQSKPFELPSTTKWRQRRTKLKERDRYDSNGSVQLGGPIEVLVNSDSESDGFPFSPPLKENRLVKDNDTILEGSEPRVVEPEPEPFEEQIEREREIVRTELGIQPVHGVRLDPATPYARKWGLGSILNSARNVSKYIPLIGARATSAGPQIAEDAKLATPLAQPLPPQIVLQTEPRPTTQFIVSNNAPATENVRPSKKAQSQKTPAKSALKTKQQLLNDRKRRAERDFMREQADFVRADDARKAQEAKDREALRRRAEEAAVPGGKRKRLPSPDTIPNPPGVSYGMDLDYFCYSSSDEEVEQITPTKQPPNKRSRLSLPQSVPGPVIGDPHRAQPYTGVYFADPTDKYHGGNVFGETASSANAASRAATAGQAYTSPPMRAARAAAAKAAAMGPVKAGAQVTQAELIARGYLDDTPNSGIPPPSPIQTWSNTFAVPEPSDSDSDEDVENEAAISTGSVQNPTSTKFGDTWTQPPPPPPNPVHAALPSGGIDDEQLNDAIAKARANARKYAPTKSSLLRQSNEVASPLAVETNNPQPSKNTESSAKVEETHPATNAFAQWQKNADPAVSRLIDGTWTDQDLIVAEDELGAELSEYLAADQSSSGDELDEALDEYFANIPPKPVEAKMKTIGNFDAYAAFMQTADPAVVDLIESHSTVEDLGTTAAIFQEEMDAFIA